MATDSHKVLWYSRWLSPFSSHQVFKFSLIICSWILYKIFILNIKFMRAKLRRAQVKNEVNNILWNDANGTTYTQVV